MNRYWLVLLAMIFFVGCSPAPATFTKRTVPVVDSANITTIKSEPRIYYEGVGSRLAWAAGGLIGALVAASFDEGSDEDKVKILFESTELDFEKIILEETKEKLAVNNIVGHLDVENPQFEMEIKITSYGFSSYDGLSSKVLPQLKASISFKNNESGKKGKIISRYFKNSYNSEGEGKNLGEWANNPELLKKEVHELLRIAGGDLAHGIIRINSHYDNKDGLPF